MIPRPVTGKEQALHTRSWPPISIASSPATATWRRSIFIAGLVSAGAGVPAREDFRAALVDVPHLAVISEVKRRSPSRRPQRGPLDGGAGGEYERGGASCLSCSREFFGGFRLDLQAARACALSGAAQGTFTVVPTTSSMRLMGADCVLLIAAALDAAELISLFMSWPSRSG
jgi:indole-3-glycerol phosphate synthase